MASYSTIKKIMNEKKSDYQVYFSSYSAAIKEIEKYGEKYGYTFDDTSDPTMIGDQMATKVGMGPKRPNHGRTNKFHFDLYKNNKLQKKKLHAQVYGDEGRFELNLYIS